MKGWILGLFLWLVAMPWGQAGAKPLVAVSVPPLAYLVQQLAGDQVQVLTLVPGRQDPHSYEPKPKEMLALAQARLYFSIEPLEFDRIWLPRLQAQNPQLKLVSLTQGLKLLPWLEAHSEDEKAQASEAALHAQLEGQSQPRNLDPHVWLSPRRALVMLETIFKALVALEPKQELIFRVNFLRFSDELKAWDQAFVQTLAPLSGQSVMVQHPNWGYFLDDYGLHQVSLEQRGSAPKPADLARLIRQGKEQKVRLILTQPQFDDKAARLLAQELKVKLVPLDPLEFDLKKNLESLVKILVNP